MNPRYLLSLLLGSISTTIVIHNLPIIQIINKAYESGVLFWIFTVWFVVAILLTIILASRMRPDPLEEDEEANVES